jgi:hypothetical protein
MRIAAALAPISASALAAIFLANPALSQEDVVYDELSSELLFCERRSKLAGELFDMKRQGSSVIEAYKAVESMEPAHQDYLRGAISKSWRLFPTSNTQPMPPDFAQSFRDSVMIECMDQAFGEPTEQE